MPTVTPPPSLFSFLMIPPPPRSTLFPYTTLFRSVSLVPQGLGRVGEDRIANLRSMLDAFFGATGYHMNVNVITGGDRKSTRLNSSHTVISYAVFCLKKKKKNR